MGIKYYVAKARVWPYNKFYFTYMSSQGCEQPVLNVVNPADYNIYEVTEEEYRANQKEYKTLCALSVYKQSKV